MTSYPPPAVLARGTTRGPRGTCQRRLVRAPFLPILGPDPVHVHSTTRDRRRRRHPPSSSYRGDVLDIHHEVRDTLTTCTRTYKQWDMADTIEATTSEFVSWRLRGIKLFAVPGPPAPPPGREWQPADRRSSPALERHAGPARSGSCWRCSSSSAALEVSDGSASQGHSGRRLDSTAHLSACGAGLLDQGRQPGRFWRQQAPSVPFKGLTILTIYDAQSAPSPCTAAARPCIDIRLMLADMPHACSMAEQAPTLVGEARDNAEAVELAGPAARRHRRWTIRAPARRRQGTPCIA